MKNLDQFLTSNLDQFLTLSPLKLDQFLTLQYVYIYIYIYVYAAVFNFGGVSFKGSNMLPFFAS